jgi:hypothetical protein
MSNWERRHHAYRRSRALARSLHARIYAAGGRLWLVSGKPDFGKYWQRLARLRRAPPPERAPRPGELGFPAECDGELTAHALQIRSHALTRWSQFLAEEARSAPPNRRRSRQIEAERREIERLRERLAELHRRRRGDPADGSTSPQPFLLTSQEERLLAGALAAAEQGRQLPPLTRWHARLVLWTSGKRALARFLDAIAPLAQPDEDIQDLGQLRTLIPQLHTLIRRIGSDHRKSLHDELRAMLQSTPATLIAAGPLSSRLRGRTLEEHCRLLIARCERLLAEGRDGPVRRASAAMAALAACDGETSPLPRRLVHLCLTSRDARHVNHAVRSLYAEAGKPKYGALLAALERLDTPADPFQYAGIREMLAGGASLDDVAWAQREFVLECFTQPRPTVPWGRNFMEELRRRGICLAPFELRMVTEAAGERDDAIAFERFLCWLRRFSPSTFTPRTSKLVRKALIELITFGVGRLACHDPLREWASSRLDRAPRAARDGCEQITAWLGGIAFYQKLAGEEASLPKSIQRLLAAGEAMSRERAFLRAAVAEGHATPGQRARLAHLDHEAEQQRVRSTSRLQRTAEKAFLATSLDALRAIVSRKAAERWAEVAGAPLPHRSVARRLAFAAWVSDMDPSQRALLRRIILACREHGAGYKRRLPANHRWLEKAADRGMNLEAWLQPEPDRRTIDGREVVIAASHDPHEIFMMGSYFGTCLSQGNCNQMSVLANAHDADKQVLFLRDAGSNVLARQLVAVSGNFGLLGYHCYTVIHHRDTATRDRCIAAMASYCGRWARRCGIPLADEGEPEPNADHFWYDDGAHAWHDAAKQAWTAEAPEPSIPRKAAAAETESLILA